jgi:hypothetical protein
MVIVGYVQGVNSALPMGRQIAVYALLVVFVRRDQSPIRNALQAIDARKAHPARARAKCLNTNPIPINLFAYLALLLLNQSLTRLCANRIRLLLLETCLSFIIFS